MLAAGGPAVRPAVVPIAGVPAGGGRVAWAAAKVNLFLELLGKRPDGYHDLETLVLTVDLFDTLEVQPDPTGAVTLSCDPPGLPTGPDNLVVKAAAALKAACGVTLGARIRLTKRIPTEAGLGGGSSDAATALAVLNAVWQLHRPVEELAAVAGGIGSDVAAFLHPPAAFCTGRGEVVTPAPVGGDLHLVIAKPPVGCPTGEVYKHATVPSRPVSAAAAREALRSGDVAALGRALHNRLQEPAFAVRPEVGRVFRTMRSLSPAGCLMSGSGASVFALATTRSDAVALARRFALSSDVSCRLFVVRGFDPHRP